MGSVGERFHVRNAPPYSNGEINTLSLTTSDTISDDGDSEDNTSKDGFETKFKLLLAERENCDLKVKVAKTESEARTLRARNKELEARPSVDVSRLSVCEDLQAKYDRLAHAVEEKELKLRMDGLSPKTMEETDAEAKRVHAQLQELKETNLRLTRDLEHLLSRLEEVKAGAQEHGKNQAMFNGLQETITLQRSKIEDLSNKNYEMTSKHFNNLQVAKTAAVELDRLTAKKLESEVELKDIQQKLTAAEADRDWHQKEHTQMLEVRNALNADRSHDTPQTTRLKSKNHHLKSTQKDLEETVSNLKLDIAFYITHLDLAEAGIRVFTCKHDSIDDIPDRNNTTNVKTAGKIAGHFFRDYEHDEDFLKHYNGVRQFRLDHHRAHERVQQGRGDLPEVVKERLLWVDGRRQVSVTYR